MALTTEQLAAVRVWVGNGPTDQALHDRYERLGSVDQTVLEELRSQLTVLNAQPGSFSLPSGLSVTTQSNAQVLERLIKEFRNAPSLDTPQEGVRASVAKLVRPDRR